MKSRRSFLAFLVTLLIQPNLAPGVFAQEKAKDSAPARAKAVWVFEIKEDDDGHFRGKVFLEVNGKRSLILGNAIGNYAEGDREWFAKNKIPAGALTACAGASTGTIERFYAIQKGANVEVYQRTESAEDPTDVWIGEYKLVKTIPVK